jgi:hypothetical protein
MKYLKLFENYNDDEPYIRTTQEEFDSIGFDSEYKGVKFHAHLKQQILDKLSSDWRPIDHSKDLKNMYSVKLTDTCELRLRRENGSQLFIYHNDDEWFYCEYYNVDSMIILDRYQYYKCDQFDGLLELLFDLEIIN